jgi:hypothetical protein
VGVDFLFYVVGPPPPIKLPEEEREEKKQCGAYYLYMSRVRPVSPHRLFCPIFPVILREAAAKTKILGNKIGIAVAPPSPLTLYKSDYYLYLGNGNKIMRAATFSIWFSRSSDHHPSS